MARNLPAVMKALAVCATALTVMACGGASHPTNASPIRTATPTATPSTPTPSPTADTESIQVLASGVGSYLLQAQPVAILHNPAAAHTALGVVVDFTVHSPSGSHALTSSPDVSLFPGQTLAVAALCTDPCDNATSTEVAVTVGSWASGGGAVLTANSPVYLCVDQHDSTGCTDAVSNSQGTVSGTVSGTAQTFEQIELTGVCTSAAGVIVDSGTVATVWPGGASATMTVSVLGSPRLATCQLYAVAI